MAAITPNTSLANEESLEDVLKRCNTCVIAVRPVGRLDEDKTVTKGLYILAYRRIVTSDEGERFIIPVYVPATP